MKFPTIMLQLRTDEGLPVDIPDELQVAAIDIGMQLQEAWLTGVDVVYGLVSRESFLDAEKQVEDETSIPIIVPVELDNIEDCRNEIAHMMRSLKDMTDENVMLRNLIAEMIESEEE
mgnify:CR=1 FL=1|tara:strand:+ start:1176 stop:1526 length:351 start_codon:yes stop_codon:yes gene_type:complete